MGLSKIVESGSMLDFESKFRVRVIQNLIWCNKSIAPKHVQNVSHP